MLDPSALSALEHRRQVALAQLDVYVDVLSAWRGRYEDDDAWASIKWITGVIPEKQAEPQRGWLCVAGPFGETTEQGIGWQILDNGAFEVRDLARSLSGLKWPVTRGQFRAAAKASGVILPSRHATLFPACKHGVYRDHWLCMQCEDEEASAC